MKHIYKSFSIILLLVTGFSQSTIGQITASFSTTGPVSACGNLVVEFQDNSIGNPTEWWWDFGNGFLSTEQNPITFYDTPGLYNVCLKVSDGVSVDTLILENLIEVYPIPNVSIQLSNNLECAPMSTQFTDLTTSTTPIVSWFWNFGDGGNGLDQNPTYTYQQDGSYDVSLFVTDTNGCEHITTVDNMVKVLSNPEIDFNVSQNLVCDSSEIISFINNTIGAESFKWNFGDGTISLLENPTHVYDASGLYDIELLAFSSQGCTDTLYEESAINIMPDLFANVVLSESEICDSIIEVAFSMSASNANEFVWDFGDGQVSNLVSPVHIYNGFGEYNIELQLSYNSNCLNTIPVSQSVSLYKPIDVEFIADSTFSCDFPFNVSFSNHLPSNSIFNWDFGDGNSSSDQFPSHNFENPGQYDVSLSIIDSNNCQSSLVIEDYVRITPLNVSFDVSEDRGCVPLNVQFSDSTLSHDLIASWEWDFGDGSTSSIQNPVHTYNSPSSYTVKLKVETESGCVAQLIMEDLIKVSEPAQTSFTVSDTATCPSNPVVFTDISTSIETIDYWIWNFGDGSSSTQQNPSHLFEDTGYVDVSLITSVNGCKDTMLMASLIYVASPVLNFIDEHTCDNPYKVQFLPEIIGADSWVWDLGDGTTSTDATFFHDYSDRGDYLVKLIAVNNESGCVTQKSKVVKITDPKANFIVDSLTPAVGCPPLVVHFQDLSVDQYFDFLWYGDGDSTNWMYFNQYEEPGYYSVQQLVIDEYGCRDTLKIDSLIHVIDVAAELGEINLVSCTPLTLEFNNTSTSSDSIIDWIWNFSDGQTSIEQNPEVQFSDNGFYDLTLYIKTSFGCLDSTVYSNIFEYVSPFVEIVLDDSVLCVNELGSAHSIYEGVNPSLTWSLEQQVLDSSCFSFTETGSYNLSVEMVDSFGCSFTDHKQLIVDAPIANFTASSVSSNCPPLITQFQSINNVDVVGWEWHFGDGNQSIVESPSNLYTTSGDYDVSLVITNINGCSDTAFIEDVVNILGPYGEFFVSDTTVCASEPIQFNASMNNTVSILWDFGDGTFQTGITTVHAYDTLGAFLPIALIENSVGCQSTVISTDSVFVINNTISLELLNDTAVCKHEELQINLNTSGNVISWSPTTSLSDTTIHNPIASPDTTTDYVVLVEDGYCVNTDTFTVFVNEFPEVMYDVSSHCVGDEILFSSFLNYSDPVFYSWIFNGVQLSDQDSFILEITTPGTHIVELDVLYANTNCNNSFVDSIVIHDLTPVSLLDELQACKSDIMDIHAGGGVMYDFGDGFSSDSIYSIQAVTDSYHQVAMMDENGCFSLDSIALTVHELPFVNVLSDYSVCSKDTLEIVAQSNAAIYWEDLAYAQEHYMLIDSASSFVHFIAMTDEGCELKDSVFVEIYDLPEIELDFESHYCVGDEVQLEVFSTNNDLDLNWIFNDLDRQEGYKVVKHFENSGNYNLTINAINNHGCFEEFNYSIIVNESPIADFYFDNHSITDLNPDVFFYNNSSPNSSVLEWAFGDGVLSDLENPKHSFNDPGVYVVNLLVENEFGCSSEKMKELIVGTDYTLYIPNAFTPNGDFIDEFFAPKGHGVDDFQMIVYNRWGEEIFLTQDIETGWNGIVNGFKKAPAGVYTYRIVTSDNGGKVRTYQGEINLIL